MPGLKRTFLVDPNPGPGPWLKVATILPIRKYRFLPAFMRMSRAVGLELRRSPGIVRFTVRAHPLRRVFYTLSVWRDRESMNAFVSSTTHMTAIARFETWKGPGANFVDWSATDPTLDWTDALARLRAAPPQYT